MISRIEWATRAIAQPAAIQLSLFPEFVEASDELALSWEQAYNEFQNDKSSHSDSQRCALENLDKYMSTISGSVFSDIWTTEGLFYSLEWQKMRELAKVILLAMGWPDEVPPQIQDIYVGNEK